MVLSKYIELLFTPILYVSLYDENGSLSHCNYLVINMKINGTILVTSNLKQTKIGPLFSKQLMHTLFVNGCYVLMASLHKK